MSCLEERENKFKYIETTKKLVSDWGIDEVIQIFKSSASTRKEYFPLMNKKEANDRVDLLSDRKKNNQKFVDWVKKFAACSNSQIQNFLNNYKYGISLLEMKRLFAEKYQDRIEFSYVLGVEKKLTREVHFKKDDYPLFVFDGCGLGGHYGDALQ